MAEATGQATPAASSGRLIYANPRSLPSYPSSGLPSDGAAAGAAATLGWQNQKSIEPWKPDSLSSASAAAVLAKDYKMAPSWSPSSDSAGHQAAVLAVGSASSALKHQRSQSNPHSQHQGWGSSAATQAFHASRPSSSSTHTRDLSHGSTAATQAFISSRSQSVRNANASSSASPHGDRSLAAAKGAMASSRNRPRAISTPVGRPTSDSRLSDPRASLSALNGATTAHRASMLSKAPIEDSGAVPVTTMTRNMFTSHPALRADIEEEQNNQRLHQSAVEMAKKMYSQQRRIAEEGGEQNGDSGEGPQTSTYTNLQDAAYKQAQERLSKMHNEHTESRNLQEYYGHTQAPKRRFSVTNRLRRRHSRDGFDDREESEKIRQQMSMFSNKLTEVDKTKRQSDRHALMVAAQRNVKARLQGMDEKVYEDTGMINPTLSNDWNLKAQEAAQSRITSTDENKGKLNLGGGMYMDQEEIDAIAARNMQPVLDDLNEKAEKERERLAAIKLEEDEKKQEQARQKELDRLAKERDKKVKEEDRHEEKLRKQKEKEEERAKKEQEKAERAEKKRLAREEKRKSKHDSGAVADDVPEDNAEEPVYTSPVGDPTAHERDVALGKDAHDAGQTVDSHGLSDGSPQHSHKVRGWLKNHLSRNKAAGEDGGNTKPEQSAKEDPGDKAAKRRSFFFGRGSPKKATSQPNASATSLGHGSGSMRDVAMAGKPDLEGEQPREAPIAAGQRSALSDSRGVSPISSVSSLESRSRKDRFSSLDMMPPRALEDPGPRSSISPSRDSRFREEI